jgi:hypothetical protein
MSSPTFPTPDPDAPDPVGGNDGDPQSPQSPQSPETPEPCDEEDSAAYLEELMAAVAAGEELTAGDISGAGFGQDGTAQQMHPGPVLATLVHAATTDEKILATLSDDDLIGVIAAVRRIGSFAAWAELTAVREFATRPDPRRPAPDPGAPGAKPGARGVRGVDARDPNAAVADLPGRPKVREFAADELAPDLHLSWHPGYRPGRKLRHLVTARNATCTAPGCGQPAARCDLDHTTPWHLGGLTCPCNIFPLCRHHHRVKQAQGWWLDSPEPGVLIWRTPAGRTYTTTPTVYPIV